MSFEIIGYLSILKTIMSMQLKITYRAFHSVSMNIQVIQVYVQMNKILLLFGHSAAALQSVR